jgi:dienelactone hydrolase
MDRKELLASAYPFPGQLRLSRRRFTSLTGASMLAGGLLPPLTSAQDATPDHAGRSSAVLHVSPVRVRFDEAFDIRVSGVEPGQEVTITSKFGGFAAEATYLADERGRVYPSGMKPIEGNFDVADSMAFIWAATKAGGDQNYYPSITVPELVTLSASGHGSDIGTIVIERFIHSVGYTEEYISNDDMVGIFYPPGAGSTSPAPAIIVLGGSEGRLSSMTDVGATLAADGYAVLYLAYFGIGTLPIVLERIPLEYFAKAITWLQQRPEVRPDRIGVCGFSVGGDLALILGSYMPEISSVVCRSGRGYISPGLGGDISVGAWTWKGKELVPPPWHSISQPEDAFGATELQQYEIPVERVNGPILLVSGDDDPYLTTPQSQVAWERLQRESHPWPDQFLSYPGAGHLIAMPYRPMMWTQETTGGDVLSNQIASVNSWRAILQHFATSLKPFT